MITAMSRADEATREMLRTAYRDPALSDAEKIGKVKSIYDRLDVPRLTEQQIQLRFERALSILDTLSVEPARTSHGTQKLSDEKPPPYPFFTRHRDHPRPIRQRSI